MLAITQLYNQKFKKFLCYHQVQDSIICKYNLSNYKRSKFDPTSRNCNLYTPIACIKTTNQDLVWDDFEQFYALITSSQQIETCILDIPLSYFLESWAKYKKFKFVLLVVPNNTPPTCWKLGQEDLDHDDQCILQEAKWIRRMSHHLTDKNQ